MGLVFERTEMGCTLGTYCDACDIEVGGDDGLIVCLSFDSSPRQSPVLLHAACLEELRTDRPDLALPAVVDLAALPHILLSVLVVDARDSERAALQYATQD